ncbi:hypothetical protein D3C72_1089750 [compost metagenome]
MAFEGGAIDALEAALSLEAAFDEAARINLALGRSVAADAIEGALAEGARVFDAGRLAQLALAGKHAARETAFVKRAARILEPALAMHLARDEGAEIASAIGRFRRRRLGWRGAQRRHAQRGKGQQAGEGVGTKRGA